MKRLSLFLAIFMTLGTVSTASFASEKENVKKSNPKLAKSQLSLNKLKAAKEAKAAAAEYKRLYTEVVDAINDEIAKVPKVNSDPKFRKAFNDAKKTCTADPTTEKCLVQLDAAFDMAIAIADKK